MTLVILRRRGPPDRVARDDKYGVSLANSSSLGLLRDIPALTRRLHVDYDPMYHWPGDSTSTPGNSSWGFGGEVDSTASADQGLLLIYLFFRNELLHLNPNREIAYHQYPAVNPSLWCLGQTEYTSVGGRIESEFHILEISEEKQGSLSCSFGYQSFKFHKIPIRHQQLDEWRCILVHVIGYR